MHLSRRQFVKSTGAAGVFLASRFHGLPVWAENGIAPHPCFLHTGSGYAPFIDAFVKQLQPGADEFLAEKYAAELEAILKGWRDLLTSSTRDLGLIHANLGPDLDACPMGEATIKPLRQQQPAQSDIVTFTAPRHMSSEEFLGSLRTYLGPFSKVEVAELQIDALEVMPAAALQLRTRIHYDLLGSLGSLGSLSRGGREERTGHWEITWGKSPAGGWSILSWTATREARSRLTGPGFVDITASCFRENSSYHRQMQRGLDYWRTTLDGASGIDIYGNNGVSVGDFDGDGFDDLYVCQPAGLPNRLYRNRGDGTFVDVTEKAGVGVLDGTSSAIFADLNNNGHQDLIVVRTSGPLLFVNRGDGSFELRPDAFRFARPPQGTFTGIAVADYDRNGLLDVYFCLYSYYQGLSQYDFPKPYYDAQNGPPNFLFKNRGDHSFEDVTVSSGIDQNNNRFSFTCGWNDYNKDGWPDLYVVNDFGRKNLYRNNGDGTFADVSAEAGVEDPGAGMSVCWFDYDNDGYDDLYVANMWSAAGKRVSTQNAFMSSASANIRAAYQKHANGNSLFHNAAGRGEFRNVTEESGTRLGRWSWCSDAWDFDHDGFPDLYVTNGFISGAQKDNLSSFFWRQIVARSLTNGGNSKDYGDAWSAINEFIRSDHSWSGYQRNNFYLNNGDGTFTEAAGVLGLDFLDDSRSFALADLDHDGRLEVVLKNRNSPQIRLLQNRLNLEASTISFSLQGTRSNRDAIGAVVEVETAKGRQQNTIRAGSGYLAQHSKTLTFGLGVDPGAVRATVTWPTKEKQVFEKLPSGHRIHIVEGSATFDAVRFNPVATYDGPQSTVEADPLDTVSETWLAEPISAPDFTLKDRGGVDHSLHDSLGKFLLAVFWQSGCVDSQSQLRSIQKQWTQWRQSKIEVLAIRVDEPGADSDVQRSEWNGFPFPVLQSDEATRGIYNIFHRYLFERRRDLVLPTSFLIDSTGAVVKIYSGPIESAEVLKDMAATPVDVAGRLKRALPFEGHYFGSGMHHNYFTYGVAFLQYGYLDQALNSFQQAIARNPEYAASYYNVGLIFLNKGNFDDAKTNLEKATQLDAGNADAWNNLGVVAGQKGDLTQAQQQFERAVSLQPTHVLAIQNLVKLYRYLGKLDQARALLEKAVQTDPSQAELHLGLAMVLVELKDLSQAKTEFEQVVKLRPDNAEGLNGLGVVLMQMSSVDDAMRRFEECRRVAPTYDRPYLNLAVLYMNAGQTQKAHDILSQYLTTQPDDQDVRDALQEVDRNK